MDQGKIGRFIATMRKQKGITQEELGEHLGVTGKTVSRWETGKYMPDIDKLQELSAFFQVSLDELLIGKRNQTENSAPPVTVSAQKSSFGLQERVDYFKEKWLRDHTALIVFWVLALLALLGAVFILKQPLLYALVPIAGLVIYGYLRNQMMIYVEDRAYRS